MLSANYTLLYFVVLVQTVIRFVSQVWYVPLSFYYFVKKSVG